MQNAVAKKERPTLTDRLRVQFKGVLDPIAAFFNRIGLMPNTMTLLGLIGNVIGAVLLAKGELTWGGLLVLAMGPVDALDGSMARLRGQPTKFGGFVDSVTDRYSELVIFGGLIYYYLHMGQGHTVEAFLVYAAAAGSVLVSYIRARGQSLGYDTKIGLLSRLERYLVLTPSLIFRYPMVGVTIIAVFANITAVQRILDVRRQAFQDQNPH